MTTKDPIWFWSHDITQSNISSLITPGTRLVRLSNYRNGNRQRFAALLYTEPGPITRYSFDLPAKDALELQGNNQRPISITVDIVGDVPKFTLVTEENVQSTSSLKIDINEAELKALVNDKQGISDLTTYTINGKRLFGAIVERRTTQSWLFTDVTESELNKQLRKSNTQLVRVRSYNDAAGKQVFAAVAEPSQANVTTWWYADLSADEVGRKLEKHHAYPVDLNAMDYNDQLRFTVIMRASK